MNKKIYYNNCELTFTEIFFQSSQNQTFKTYARDSKETLKNIIEEFTKKDNVNSFIILNYDFETVLNYLKNNFSYIEASGGFIENNKKFLFIHRLGKWDLPKGKLEKNETAENGAIRECEEECSIEELKIKSKLNSTYHIYPYKSNFAIKQTFWFYMNTNYSKTLKPQLEENIDEVKWFSEKEIETVVIKNTYLTIKDVIKEAISLANKEN